MPHPRNSTTQREASFKAQAGGDGVDHDHLFGLTDPILPPLGTFGPFPSLRKATKPSLRAP